tara:strand:- start:203421 stop:204542 length:1122 start_codon:yes stop_codon:yes gene_type:complete
MGKIKVISVIGTRPEAIKMAPVIKALERSEQHESILCSTGQHREMLDQMIKLFELKVDYSLNIMKANQTLAEITSKVIAELDKIIAKEKPDWLLVQGDTSTCFAAALTAFYCGVKVGHVEAGLRTYNLQSPFPEEANRQLVSRISTLNFSPTDVSENNLLTEGTNKNAIVVTGNTVVDALLWINKKVRWQDSWCHNFSTAADVVKNNKNYVLVTGHRRENHGHGMENICQALLTLAHKYPDWHFIYPVHLNPNVQTPVLHNLSDVVNIHLIAPQDYEPFIFLLRSCRIVLTDSGGVQEEAPSLGKPVLVMRDTTERPEGVTAGTSVLVGTDKEKITAYVSSLIDDPKVYGEMANAVNPYGDGTAAEKIIAELY